MFPVAVVSVVAALLGLLYLDYVVDPQRNLHDFPIALVNQDVGETLGAPGQQKHVNFGDQVADGLRAAVPADQIDLRVLGLPEAQQQMQNGQVYGTVVIPSDFSKRLGILGVGSVIPGDIERPIITLLTNPRSGTYATQIVVRFGDQALPQINEKVGQQLTEQVRTQLTPAPGGPPAPELSGATRLTLAQPLQILVQEFHPLPGGSGQGLTAFFYALLLLMAGMLGAMIVHTMIDSALGFVPTEYGPWYVHYPATPVSRLRTLLIKWAVMAVAAVVVSAILLGIGAALGMPLDNPLGLYLYGVLAIIAVGFTGISILAAIGSAGLLVNMILFIVLGLPSSGGTVPIEATPKYLGWLATFEPMHQVFLAVRSLLYFDGNGAAGFTRGFWMTVLGLTIGVVLGVVVTRFYDRKGLERKPINRTEPAPA
ncbi:YhgE/Pip domain-containing protein [Nocardia sp. NRRL WC-3656]|uniref:YhgE/Pip domain-containing protein n=1 Tax=Nocardia sp. NRRL WC-3656 TaxID=1463824 RepID=UPI0004C31B2A|nr:ABC transporter permease [Nocardia sp. NRRL WC-3656]